LTEEPPTEQEDRDRDEASVRIDQLSHEVERQREGRDAALRYVEGIEDRFAELSVEHERLGEESQRAGSLHRETIEAVLDQAATLARELSLEKGRLLAAKSETQEVNDRGRERVEELLDEAGRLAIQLAQSRERIDHLTDERDDRDVQVRQLEADTTALRTRSSQAEESAEKLGNALRKAATMHADQLRQAAELHAGELHDLQEDLSGRAKNLEGEALEAAQVQANRQLAAASKTEQALAEDLDSTRDKLAESRQELGGITADLKTARQEIAEGAIEEERLQRINDSQAEALKLVQEARTAEGTDLAELKAKFGSSQAEASGVRERLRLLNEDHEALTVSSAQSGTNFQHARQDVHRLKLDLERTSSEAAEFSAQLTRAEDRARDADNRTHSIKAELDRGREDLQSRAAELRAQEVKISQLESDITAARESIATGEANLQTEVAAELASLRDEARMKAEALESSTREVETLGHAAAEREREFNRLSVRLTARESEIEEQRASGKDLERRLTETLARLGKSEDLVEEARLLESQTIEPPQDPRDEPPVHHDPEAERHIAWLQTELVRANRDGERRMSELAGTLSRVEQLLKDASQRERGLKDRILQLKTGDPGATDSVEDPEQAHRGRRLRPPRW
jgi:chromosome segregation ATPase